jgi:GNAT superfamily N-acetyltransferase
MASGAIDVRIRPMASADVAELEPLSAQSYFADHGGGRSPEEVAAWLKRTKYLLATDPAGCWVAEDRDLLIGFAIALEREKMWILASYAVLPGRQGVGIGRMLLSAAMSHGRGALRGMLVSSADPRATRHYRQAGFSLHPKMAMRGQLDRQAIPPVDRVREGSVGDFELMDSIDRRIRGAAHGPDHAMLLQSFHLLVSDRTTGSGYAFVSASGTPVLLAATNRRTAAALLWEAIAATPAGSPASIEGITANNEWAIDVGLAAGLSLATEGYVGLRQMRPPLPYLPHRALA